MSLPTLILLAALLLQHGGYLGDSKNAAIGNPEAIAAGAKLYATSCAGCHGPDGSGGRGPNLVRRAAWHPLSDEGIFNAIRNGLPGADMPPTKLDDDQTWKLVAFIHAISGPASENKVPGNPEAGQAGFLGRQGGLLELPFDSRPRRAHGARPDKYRRLPPAWRHQAVGASAVEGSDVSWATKLSPSL